MVNDITPEEYRAWLTKMIDKFGVNKAHNWREVFCGILYLREQAYNLGHWICGNGEEPCYFTQAALDYLKGVGNRGDT